MSRLFLMLARAFIGWGMLFNNAAEWCIQQGYRNIDR
jgi:hypothetical protein